ncbi:hypothetical protein TSUD_17470 [Trifolium subterraneum]|uniref:Uncharacterized protein n=1 Tax=Trifolium subterraneum TaxID=3900 RepID=A0A2Z6MNU1_TRISU|nr:hypothetical protein TSUD_17470 [Trifolium subterraneum]
MFSKKTDGALDDDEECKRQIALATQDSVRQIDESMSLKTWTGVVGGKLKGMSRLTPIVDPEDDRPYHVYMVRKTRMKRKKKRNDEDEEKDEEE